MTDVVRVCIRIYIFTDNPYFWPLFKLKEEKLYLIPVFIKKDICSPRGNTSICMACNTVYSGTKEEYTGNGEARTWSLFSHKDLGVWRLERETPVIGYAWTDDDSCAMGSS